MRKVVRFGLEPLAAIRMATINAAQHFAIRNKGAVLPGYDADLIVVDNIRNINVEKVFKSGKLAAEEGKCKAAIRHRHTISVRAGRMIRARLLTKRDPQIFQFDNRTPATSSRSPERTG